MFSHISFPPRFEFLFWWYDLNLFFMIFSQKAEFYKSCSTRWLFLYYLWRSTLKIMIKVPVNLIRQKSPLEMYLLNASPVRTAVKYRPSVDSPLPLPEEWLSAAAITWQTSTRIKMMDSEHNKVCIWNYSHPSRNPKFNNAVWRQDNINENQNVAKSISLSLVYTQAAD